MKSHECLWRSLLVVAGTFGNEFLQLGGILHKAQRLQNFAWGNGRLWLVVDLSSKSRLLAPKICSSKNVRRAASWVVVSTVSAVSALKGLKNWYFCSPCSSFMRLSGRLESKTELARGSVMVRSHWYRRSTKARWALKIKAWHFEAFDSTKSSRMACAFGPVWPPRCTKRRWDTGRWSSYLCRVNLPSNTSQVYLCLELRWQSPTVRGCSLCQLPQRRKADQGLKELAVRLTSTNELYNCQWEKLDPNVP